MLDKPPEDFNRKDFLKVIEEKQIERITFHYTALDGQLKELKLPVLNRARAEQILVDGERVDGSSLFKGIVDPNLSDLYIAPVYQTAFLHPFDCASLNFICRFVTQDAKLAPFALDTVLHNAYQLFQKNTLYQLHAAGELEFFLLREPSTRIYPATRQGGYHASPPFFKSGQILDEMVRCIAQITGNVKYAHSEVGYAEDVPSDLEEIKGKRAEQLEIEFLPTPITETGDILMLARWVVRNVAYKYGFVATFTPKIDEGIAGNGLHVHMMVKKNDKNIMTGESGSLTADARKIIGGLCTYADSLTAFGNTVSSSYLRLVPSQEAPTRICWSDLNRNAMIRVPLGWSKANNLVMKLYAREEIPPGPFESQQTVELRSPDGSAIIYLLLAGITMAAEWGLGHQESEQIANNLHATTATFLNERLVNKLSPLPTSCVDSSRVLQQKRHYYEREGIFPASIVEYMVESLQAEKDEDLKACLANLPVDQRLREIRKTMHKDLHRH
jgi:glutamine synthetase